MANQHLLATRMPAARSRKQKKSATGRRRTSEDDRNYSGNAGRERRKMQRPGSARQMETLRQRNLYMLGAAERFNGLSEELQLRMEMRNITARPDGYLVQIQRGGKRFTRWFQDLSDESLAGAIEFRDEAERIVGDAARNAVPAWVLAVLGLPAPVRGIHRDPRALSHDVLYKDARGKTRSRAFQFKYVPEQDAYATAIAFLEETVAAEC